MNRRGDGCCIPFTDGQASLFDLRKVGILGQVPDDQCFCGEPSWLATRWTNNTFTLKVKKKEGVMGTFRAGSVFLLPVRIGVALLVSLAFRCSGCLLCGMRQFFIAAKRRAANLFTEESRQGVYMSKRIERWNGWT